MSNSCENCPYLKDKDLRPNCGLLGHALLIYEEKIERAELCPNKFEIVLDITDSISYTV